MDLRVSHDLVGNQDILNSCFEKDLCLPKLGTGDANGVNPTPGWAVLKGKGVTAPLPPTGANVGGACRVAVAGNAVLVGNGVEVLANAT